MRDLNQDSSATKLWVCPFLDIGGAPIKLRWEECGAGVSWRISCVKRCYICLITVEERRTVEKSFSPWHGCNRGWIVSGKGWEDLERSNNMLQAAFKTRFSLSSALSQRWSFSSCFLTISISIRSNTHRLSYWCFFFHWGTRIQGEISESMQI